jgi:hypothetical protein
MEPATLGLVAQCLNQLRYRVPLHTSYTTSILILSSHISEIFQAVSCTSDFHNNSVCILISPTCGACSVHLLLLQFVTIMLFGEEYTLHPSNIAIVGSSPTPVMGACPSFFCECRDIAKGRSPVQGNTMSEGSIVTITGVNYEIRVSLTRGNESPVSLDVAPCGMADCYQHFEEIFRLHLQDRIVNIVP